MNRKLTDSKLIRVFSALCFMIYFTSYITRINYGAIIAEIIQEEGILKSSAAVVTTAGFIAYGCGQLVSGYIGDRMSPKLLIFIGLIASSLFNTLMPVSGNVHIMAVIWLFNGFAQAMIWPPLVRIMSGYLNADAFKRACVTVTIASSVGTIAVYVLSPVIIHLSGWRAVFWITGITGIIISFIWLWGCGRIEHYTANGDTLPDANSSKSYSGNVPLKSLIFPSGMIFIIIAIIIQGILRDGVSTWTPSYLIEIFHLKSTVSIFSTVLLPIFSIIFVKCTSYLQRKFFTNELTCAALIFLISSLASVILASLYTCSMIVSVISAAVITGCMFGVNLILLCMVPVHFEHTGKVAGISGLFNFFAYVGSSISAYGSAKISENFGWQFTIISWAVLALLGTLICAFVTKKWKSFCK